MNNELNHLMKNHADKYASLASAYHLSECGFWILYVLRSNFAALTQRDLCEWLYQPKQSVNTAIKKLVDEGLLLLTSADNKRSKYLTLTEKGILFCEKTIDHVIEAERKAMTGLNEEEKELLLETLHKYNDLLEERFSLILL
jgi:DNA-binding MarR family transcriptional regulator